MSHEDFQERLRRISAQSAQPQQDSGRAMQTARSNLGRVHHGLLALGALLMVVGGQAIKYVYKNADTLTSDIKTGAGLAGFAAFVIGIVVMMRAIPKKGANAGVDSSGRGGRQVRQASTFGRLAWSLVGFVFGMSSDLLMFMGNAAQDLDANIGLKIMFFCVLAAFTLPLVAMALAFVGLFLPGRGLGRVPIYFIFGVIITHATLWTTRFNFQTWQPFIDFVQGIATGKLG